MVGCTEYEDPREPVICVCTVRRSEKGDVGEEEEEPLNKGRRREGFSVGP